MEPSWWDLAATTAISVSTVLGTGILALPVTLHDVGFYPFLLPFTVTLVAQFGVVCAMTELLERGYLRGSAAGLPSFLEEPLVDNKGQDGPVLRAPSFHSMSEHYLPSRPLRLMFEGAVLLHFVSIMISYSLAAPQVLTELLPAYGSLGLQPSIALFSGTACLLVLGLGDVLFPYLAGATCAKGVLLVAVIGLTLALSLQVGPLQPGHWGAAMAESFLVGSLALGGTMNIMPVTFERCLRGARQAPASRRCVALYRRASLLAVLLCYLCNVGWCAGVLLLVPPGLLAEADGMGQNSTWPLVAALARAGYGRAGLLIKLFTVISVVVSFFVMGIGMKHTLDDQLRLSLGGGLVARACYYLLWYGFILAVALCQPHALIKLLASFTSFALNLEVPFVLYMMLRSRRPGSEVPRSLAPWQVCCLGCYFAAALIVDLARYVL